MSKQTKQTSEERAALARAREAQARAEVGEKQSRRCLRDSVIAGCVVFLLSILSMDQGEKYVAFFVLIATLVVMLRRRERLAARMALPVLALLGYCLMITISCFYSPAGKFALRESLKFVLALCGFFLVLALEPADERAGQRTAGTMELSAAILSLLSMDYAGARLLSIPVVRLLSPFASYLSDLASLDGSRMNTLLNNLNVFAGVAGLAVLLGLGSLRTVSDRRARRLHLACLGVNAIAFLSSLSRAAMIVLAVSFVVYLFLERGEARARALGLMLETLCFAAAAGIVNIVTVFGSREGMRFFALAVTLVCTAGLVVFDEKIGGKLGDRLAAHQKAASFAVIGLIVLAVAGIAAAVTLSGAKTFRADEVITRAVRLAPGAYTLHAETDGELSVSVTYQTGVDSFSWDRGVLYDGSADGAEFTVPDDAEAVFFRFHAKDAQTLTALTYDGAASGRIRPDYLLLPESVANMLQAPLQSESFMQRRILWRVGTNIWRTSPVFGCGIGVYENRINGVQQYHFETKYAHNHYIQTLAETGVVGLVLFVALMASCAAALLLARRRENAHPMLPALLSCLLFMAGQAVTDIIFSSSVYLVEAFAVLALTVLLCGDALRTKETLRPWAKRAGAGLLGVWLVLVGCNIYANMLLAGGLYENFVTAAKIDWFERNDYRLSYVYTLCTAEERTETETRQMYDYIEKLEAAESNTIPYYLAFAQYSLGNEPKAYEMLRQYTAYSASDPDKWNEAFALAAQYYTRSPDCKDGLRALYQDLQDWNETSITPITLNESVENFVLTELGRA